MMPMVFVTRTRGYDEYALPIRFVDPDVSVHLRTSMWKTCQIKLEQPYVFVVTKAPRVWESEGYVDFEAVMFPPAEVEPEPGFSARSGARVCRYFIGCHHFNDGSIWELR
jgi:hypothetical protein